MKPALIKIRKELEKIASEKAHLQQSRDYKENQLIQFHKLSPEDKDAFFNNLFEIVPKQTTSIINKVIKWMLTCEINNRNGLELLVSGEDNDSLRNFFSAYKTAQNDSVFKGHKDIGKYQSFNDWLKDVTAYMAETRKQYKISAEGQTLKEGGGVTLHGMETIDGVQYELYSVTKEAATKVFQPKSWPNSKELQCVGNWCVKDAKFHKSYGEDPFYMITENGFYKYLIHFEKREFADENNLHYDNFSDEVKSKLKAVVLPFISRSLPKDVKERLKKMKEDYIKAKKIRDYYENATDYKNMKTLRELDLPDELRKALEERGV